MAATDCFSSRTDRHDPYKGGRSASQAWDAATAESVGSSPTRVSPASSRSVMLPRNEVALASGPR